MRTAKRNIISITAAVFICVSVLLSLVFVAGYAVHECTHDDNCAVCRAIDACIHTIRCAAGSYTATAAAAVFLLCAAITLTAAVIKGCTTLISLKVELRN